MSNFKKTLEGMEVEVVKVWLQDSHLMAVLMPEATDLILDAAIEAIPKDRRLPNPDKHPHKYWTIKGINAAHKTDRAILTAAKSTNPKEDE